MVVLFLLLVGLFVSGCGGSGSDGSGAAGQESSEQAKLAGVEGKEARLVFRPRTAAQWQVKAAVDKIAENEDRPTGLCQWMSEGSRQRLIDSARAVVGPSEADLNCAKAVSILKDRAKGDDVAMGGPIEVRSIKVDGRLAVVGIGNARPGVSPEITLIKEGKGWKLSIDPAG